MRLLSALLLLVPLILAGTGCKDDGTSPPPPPGGVLRLRVVHQVGGAPLRTGDAGLVNAAGNTYQVQRLDYFLGRLRLHRPDGLSWNQPLAHAFHFVSLADSTTWTWEITGVPPGTYQSMTLDVGLPDELNVDGGLGDPDPNPEMPWPAELGGGHANLRMEGSFEEGAYDLQAGLLRQGAAVFGGVAPNDLAHDSYQLSGDPVRITLVLDLDSLFDSPHVLDLGQWFPGSIQDDGPAQNRLQENLGDVLSVRSVEILVQED